jgi:hypothetical protein
MGEMSFADTWTKERERENDSFTFLDSCEGKRQNKNGLIICFFGLIGLILI